MIRRLCCERRFLLSVGLAGVAGIRSRAGSAAAETVRMGILQFGTMQWLAELVRRHGLDSARGFSLETVTLANNDAGRVALMAGAADIVLTDWFFAAKQRQGGIALSFAPFSSAAGGIMVAADSPVSDLASLAGKRLGVAGGPLDRSWLLVQAAARSGAGVDLAKAARVVYGAPPLLGAKLQQGELDAVLTYWTFAAALRVAGYREAVSVADCARALGLPERLGLLGFVFHSDWAAAHHAAVEGFLGAMQAAQDRLADAAPAADADWTSLRPLLQVPQGAAGDAQAAELRHRFAASLDRPAPQEAEFVATRVLDVLKRAGGSRATDDLDALPAGLFWPGNG